LKIIITGNMGYVGPLVVRRLRSTRPESTLIGLDTGFFAHCLTAAPRLPECGVDDQVFQDIRTFDPIILTGADAVVHLAAISNHPMGKAFETATLDVNHAASVRLAKLAREKGVSSFVFASSCSVYGAAGDAARTEEAPLEPLTAYARSKVGTEQDLVALAGEDFRITCLRFGTACGMSDRLRLDLVLNDFVASAVAGGRIDILSDGTPWRPLVHVADMARAIHWAIERDGDAGGPHVVVNVGADNWNVQIKDLAHAVAEVMPGTSISINPDASPDRRTYRVDFSLYRRLAPDHQPQRGLPDTVAELRDGLKAMGFTDRTFRDSHLIRLKVLTDYRELGLLTPNVEWVNSASGLPPVPNI
jgi:nucleoside-diphosphate-sugar epimerase